MRFAVVTDLHLYDVSVSEPGPAFDRALRSGPTLLAESRAIFASVCAGIRAEHPDFVLVCGDLTKDGERSSHRLAADMLGSLRRDGIGVYVVPGNHDILNPRAERYEGDVARPIDTVSPREFADIYADCGYGRPPDVPVSAALAIPGYGRPSDFSVSAALAIPGYGSALERDPAGSLSYVAEPLPGLWILALDSCRYGEENGRGENATAYASTRSARTPYRARGGDGPITAGRIGASTRAWVRDVLARARARGTRVIAFLHHGIMEHFRGERTWMRNYVIEDDDAVARLLAEGGVSVAFTGHSHAQDITRRTFPGRGVIYDVETAATVSWPNAWRSVSLSADGTLGIRTRTVTAIPGHETDFAAFARDRLVAAVRSTAGAVLARLGVTGGGASALASEASDAALAFLRGDERRPAIGRGLRGGDLPGALVAGLAGSTWRDLLTDLPPGDNDTDILMGGP